MIKSLFKKVVKFIARTLLVSVAMVAAAFCICNISPVDIKDKASELKSYCAKNGYNTDYAILVDMGRSSMQKRFFVYDFKHDRVIVKSLAGHGSGGNSTVLKADFSNDHGSYCSSLGHYKIGRHRHMYNRPTVPAIELSGLDKTNSNAMARGVLIHPSAGPLSWGCVTLPVVRYMQVSDLLKSLPDNVIMWVYN